MFESSPGQVLQIPLYKLLYLDEISAEPLLLDELKLMYKDYSKDEIRRIVEALEWAEKNPDYPFTSLVPGIRHSNQDAYRYLVNILHQIKGFLAIGGDLP